MADIREILVDWNASGGAGGVSVFHTLAANTPSASRLAMSNFLTALASVLCTTTTWTIRTEGRVLDSATGALVGEWADSTARTGSGSSGSTPVANATQILVRWKTDTIIGGRVLKGRTYIPGASNGVLVAGQLSTSAQGTVNTAAAAYVSSADSPVVWHRPTNGVGGAIDTAASASAWTEMAVLRRRRA